MKKSSGKKAKKVNPSKARKVDVSNLEMSLKDEANGFYHFENELADYDN